jgi:hypothetical protein
VTAPAAPVCAFAGGVIGGLIGGGVGDWVADQLPWMDEPDPGERDHDDLVDEIGSFDEEPVEEIMPVIHQAGLDESGRSQMFVDGLILDPEMRLDRYPDAPTGPLMEPLTDEEIRELIDYAESLD